MNDLPQNPNRLAKRVDALEAKNRELTSKIRTLESQLETVERIAQQALRTAESADMMWRPIGGSGYSVDMTDPTR